MSSTFYVVVTTSLIFMTHFVKPLSFNRLGGFSQTSFPEANENIKIGDSMVPGLTLTRYDIIEITSI